MVFSKQPSASFIKHTQFRGRHFPEGREELSARPSISFRPRRGSRPTTFRPALLCSDNTICRPLHTGQTDTETYNISYMLRFWFLFHICASETVLRLHFFNIMIYLFIYIYFSVVCQQDGGWEQILQIKWRSWIDIFFNSSEGNVWILMTIIRYLCNWCLMRGTCRCRSW